MKWCFDECLPPKWFRQFADMLSKRRKPIIAIHLLDQLKSGTKDDEVADWLGQQQPIMMVSGDSGAKSKSGDPRLHLLCPERKITSVFVARKLCQRDGFEKLRMMMVCMPDLERAFEGTPGERYRLETFGDCYRVRSWPLTSPDP